MHEITKLIEAGSANGQRTYLAINHGSSEAVQVVADAVRTGRIAASAAARYRRMYRRDPIATRLLLSKLAPRAKPIAAKEQEEAGPKGTGLFPELGDDA